jgi:hypothetical protein
MKAISETKQKNDYTLLNIRLTNKISVQICATFSGQAYQSAKVFEDSNSNI